MAAGFVELETCARTDESELIARVNSTARRLIPAAWPAKHKCQVRRMIDSYRKLRLSGLSHRHARNTVVGLSTASDLVTGQFVNVINKAVASLHHPSEG